MKRLCTVYEGSADIQSEAGFTLLYFNMSLYKRKNKVLSGSGYTAHVWSWPAGSLNLAEKLMARD